MCGGGGNTIEHVLKVAFLKGRIHYHFFLYKFIVQEKLAKKK